METGACLATTDWISTIIILGHTSTLTYFVDKNSSDLFAPRGDLLQKKLFNFNTSYWYHTACGSTIRRESRRGKKELKSSRDKNARHEPQWVVGRGGEELLCDPDLSYD